MSGTMNPVFINGLVPNSAGPWMEGIFASR